MELIPIFAFGSRGDILPILSIVEKILNINSSILSDVNIVLITHRCYCDEVARQFRRKIETITIESKVFQQSDNNDHKDFYINNYISAFTSKYNKKKVRVVIGNLFALKIWHFSLSLHVQCVIIHPNLPPTSQIDHDDLMNSFKDFQPKLYDTATKHKDSHSTATSLTLNDYNYFLWPTLVDQFDESILPADITSITGPIVLILSSPRICVLPCEHSRYHVCGFIKSGYLGGILQLNSETMQAENINSQLNRRFIFPILNNTAEVLQFLEIHCQDDHPTATIYVDFGSMTEILLSDGRLISIIQILLALPTVRRYLIVAHGYIEKLYDILLEARATTTSSNSNSSFSGSGGSSCCTNSSNINNSSCCRNGSTTTTIAIVAHSVDHSKILPRCTSVIHHGGVGTVGACMLAGVPQGTLSIVKHCKIYVLM